MGQKAIMLILVICLTGCSTMKKDGEEIKVNPSTTILKTASCIIVPTAPHCILENYK